MSLIVTKFGGSSLADATQFRKVESILRANPERRYAVPSAPGRRFQKDNKITDLLYSLYDAVAMGLDHDGIFSEISERYIALCADLGVDVDIRAELSTIYRNVMNGASKDYTASRGEYLNGLVLAAMLGWVFIDASDVIFFDKRGRYDSAKTLETLSARLRFHKNAVVPGFYGSMPDGSVKTFSRGGSDITGAIVAAAASADLYENWTDVSGFMKADPRIIENPETIDTITYRELRELSYMGATVLHEDAIFPVYQAAIPINVRNTNDPEAKGTMIVPVLEGEGFRGVTGIAGKKNFTIISIEKNGMNTELGFGRRVLACIEKYSIPFEHMPSGIDTLCVVLQDSKIQDNLHEIIDDIHRACEPDSVEVFEHLALIATVGRGMVRSIGTAAKIFLSLAHAHINIRMIDQGSSEMNIIVGVANSDFEKAMRAIYNGVIKDKEPIV